MQKFKVGTHYSGLGSPEEALKRLLVECENTFACDIDKYVKASYLANHNPEIFYPDVTTINNDEAPYVDLFAFGFPCQSFSLSGKRLGFEDTRGTLFFNSLEYIAKKRPRVFVAENVKGLLSHDKIKGSKSKYGRTFGVIRDALGITMNGQHNIYKYDDCVNYHIYFQVLNTKDYTIPQNRERIFIIGFRDEQDAVKFSFPKKLPLLKRLKDILEPKVDEKYYLSEKMLSYLLGRKDNFNGGRVNYKGSDVIASTLTKSSHSLDISDNIIDEEKYLKRNRITNDTNDTSPSILANQSKQSTDAVYIAESEKQVIVVNDNGELKERPFFNAIDANYGKGIDNHAQRSLILEENGETDNWIIGGLQDHQQPRTDGISPTLTSAMGMGGGQMPLVKVKESKVFAFRGRENENGKIQQNAEFRNDGLTNSITTVQKDNLVLESVNESIVFDKDNTAKGYTEATLFDSINISNPKSTTRRGRVGKQIANTLDTACNQAVVIQLNESKESNSVQPYQQNRIYYPTGVSPALSANAGETTKMFHNKRIRRLTPKECFRLMGFSDDFFEKCALVNSDTQLYKQAGNSIVVDTILHLLIQILTAINVPYTYKKNNE